MDLGARRLGLDPAELRRRNLVRPEEMPYRPASPTRTACRSPTTPAISPPPSSARSALLDYDGWRRAPGARRPTGARRIGVGLACYAQGTGLGPFEGATVRVDPSGKVYVLIGVAAQGQGHATTLAQVAAEELGAALRRRHRRGGRHRRCSLRHGHRRQPRHGQRRARRRRTAREVRGAAARVAAELLECAPDDVRIEASRAFVAGMPDRTLPLGRLAQAAVRSKALGAHRRARAQRVHVLLSRHRHVGVRYAGRRGGGGRRDRRGAAAAPTRSSTTPAAPSIRRSSRASCRRRRAGHRAPGCSRRSSTTSDGQLLTGSLMDYAMPRADDLPPMPWRSTSTARPSTRSASRASARAAPSPARPPSPTPSRTPWPTSASRSTRSR